MKIYLPLLLLCMAGHFAARAGTLTGIVTDESGKPLPYASLLVKGTTMGTATSNEGAYVLELKPGTYTLVCQYVGYARQEKQIHITTAKEKLDFRLALLQTTIHEVIVKAGGEDPAYAIIRNAIKKKKEYRTPLDSFTCDAYTKTFFKIRSLPKYIFGDTIEKDDQKVFGVDSAGKGILYLSETQAQVAFKKPDKLKLQVNAARESGRNGYGVTFPAFVNFYEDNVNVLLLVSPRGYVSPIADGAFNFYRFKYLGSFWEDGKEICRIKVIPKRKYEPLFSGTIHIMDGSWRIHSLDLILTRQQQLQLLDTLQIKQVHVPVNGNVWQIKDQVMYYTFSPFGIQMAGMFLGVYSNYNLAPVFSKDYFNKVVAVYDTAVKKKTKQYWEETRPVQLEKDEQEDYHVKDSIYIAHQDSAYVKHWRDSVRHSKNKLSYNNITLFGLQWSGEDSVRSLTVKLHGLLADAGYNPAEGTYLGEGITFSKGWPEQQRYASFTPYVRYGTSNHHLNPSAVLHLSSGQQARRLGEEMSGTSDWYFSGGKRVSQFNNQNPVSPLLNSFYLLMYHKNYIKIYENYFAEVRYVKHWDEDFRLNTSVLYEDRIPLDNTSNYSWYKKNRVFDPNYPTELLSKQFTRHQAVIASVELEYQPGQKYVQYPDNKSAIGSAAPVFSAAYSKGIRTVAGSDVDFDKWNLSVWNNMNLHLWGLFKYRVSIGGFLNTKSVPVQDYQHFNGNQFAIASRYVNSFQLAPYYANSTTAAFYAAAHAEHHFNGLLTNKIPLFRRLNWTLVAGSNAFYVNRDNNYVEVFAGLENIFKFIRVDVVGSYLDGKNAQAAVRVGLGGIFSPNMWRK